MKSNMETDLTFRLQDKVSRFTNVHNGTARIRYKRTNKNQQNVWAIFTKKMQGSQIIGTLYTGKWRGSKFYV